MKSKIMRTGINFNGEIESIKIERIKKGMDKMIKSDTNITSIIPKHKLWPKMKEDIININFKEIKWN